MQLRSAPARVVIWQLVIALLGAALWALSGLADAVAALVGGTTSALLTLQFAIRVFSWSPDAPPEVLLGAIFRAEVFKLVLATAFFMVVAKYFGHLFVPILTTFVATLVVFWVALLWKLDQ